MPEILNESKPIPEQTEIGISKVPVQEIIVNGVRQTQYAEAPALVCPKCGFAVKQFQPGTPVLSILKSLTANNDEELKTVVHCARCGQPLRILRPAPVDVGEADEK